MSEETFCDLVFRVRAVELMEQGVNVTRLSRDLGVSRWALYRWRKIYQAQGAAGLSLETKGRPLLGKAKAAYARLDATARAQAEVAVLERKVGQQQRQIDFLTRAFKRVKESRQNSGATGGTASTERSGE